MDRNRDTGRTTSSKYMQRHSSASSHHSAHRSSRHPSSDHRRGGSRDERYSSHSSSMPSRESSNYKIVEYSDVSSEDFSAPEAGEIEDDGSKRDGKHRHIDSKRGGVCVTVSGGEAAATGHKKHGSAGDRLSFAMSPGEVRKVIIGSPISSSVSSGNSRSKTPRSPPKVAHRGGGDDVLVDDGRIDEMALDAEEELVLSDEADDSDRHHRKSKKSKKAKKSKRKKKKRRRSISSVESISDHDSLLAVDDNAVGTPPHRAHHKPLRAISPWEHTYTPVKPCPMSPTSGDGPATPPLRPNSIVSMYSEESTSQHRLLIRQHATPPSPVQQMPLPLGQRNVASPHTPPPLMQHQHHKLNAYNNSPIDVDHHHHLAPQQPQSHHIHHQPHHHSMQQQHYYHGSGQPRSPIPPNSSSSTNHRRHDTKSPGLLRTAKLEIIALCLNVCFFS